MESWCVLSIGIWICVVQTVLNSFRLLLKPPGLLLLFSFVFTSTFFVLFFCPSVCSSCFTCVFHLSSTSVSPVCSTCFIYMFHLCFTCVFCLFHLCVPPVSLVSSTYQTKLHIALYFPLCIQGIWRIPVDEIDRPGSFASHMNRSIVLLLEVLYQLKDHDTLLKVSFMLQRTPDQGK